MRVIESHRRNAATLAKLRVGLTGIRTKTSLRAGLKLALKLNDKKVVPIE